MNDSFYEYDKNVPIDYHQLAHEHDYYDLFNEQFVTVNDTIEIFTTDCTLRSIFALVSRIGFIFIQTGSIPVENVYKIVLYNILEICVVLISYGLIGNRFAFGEKSAGGWIGYSPWTWDIGAISENYNDAILGFSGCLLSTAQMSTFLVGRIHMGGGMILTMFYCMIFQPFLMHWIWHKNGWMKLSKLLNRDVSIKDHGGDLALHIPSAIFGMIGALFLGRRILKLKDVDRLSFGSENVVMIPVGYLLIVLNYIIFALPSLWYLNNHPPQNFSGAIIINSFLAVGSGILASIFLQLVIFPDIYHHRRVVRSIQSGVAGLIAVAAAVDLYTPLITVLIALLASVAFFFFAEVLHNTSLEDPCSFISSHLICGFIGVMFCSLFARKENLGTTVRVSTMGVHLLWQFLCTLMVVTISIIVALFIFLLLKICHILRNNAEVLNHKRATILQDAIPKRNFMERLFAITSTTDHVVPGYRKKYFDTEIGSIIAPKVSSPDTKKIKKTISVGEETEHNKKKGNFTVMQVDTERTHSNNWKFGSGDYYDPYLDIKLSSNRKDSLKTFSEH